MRVRILKCKNANLCVHWKVNLRFLPFMDCFETFKKEIQAMGPCGSAHKCKIGNLCVRATVDLRFLPFITRLSFSLFELNFKFQQRNKGFFRFSRIVFRTSKQNKHLEVPTKK